MEFEIWIYRGLIGFILMVIWYFIKRWSVKIDQKFDELIKAVNQVGLKNETQNGQIEILNRVQATHETRLNDHAKRLRNVELNQKK
jgi:hypothetical protein